MSIALTVLAAIVIAVLAIGGLVRVSLWITEQKSTDELKKRLPDASDIHQDGGAHS